MREKDIWEVLQPNQSCKKNKNKIQIRNYFLLLKHLQVAIAFMSSLWPFVAVVFQIWKRGKKEREGKNW